MNQNLMVQIDGMMCEGCVKSVAAIVSAQAGVLAHNIDLAGGRANLTVDASRLNRDALLAALSDGGFDAQIAAPSV